VGAVVNVLYTAAISIPNGGEAMAFAKLIGIILIVAGALGLAYGGFSFTKETHETNIGPLELSVKEKETVNVPLWAGIGAVVVGIVLVLVPRKT
jgi:multidrug transporter EmrE-like cation transporter